VFGGLAQLVERLLCKQDVSGSSPLTSTATLKLTSAAIQRRRKRTRREYFLRKTKTQVRTRRKGLDRTAEDFSFFSFQHRCDPDQGEAG
jgi:hypothetical protein